VLQGGGSGGFGAAELETGNFFMVLERVKSALFVWTGRAAFMDTAEGQAISSIACCTYVGVCVILVQGVI